jgi:hypothetical protein
MSLALVYESAMLSFLSHDERKVPPILTTAPWIARHSVIVSACVIFSRRISLSPAHNRHRTQPWLSEPDLPCKLVPHSRKHYSLRGFDYEPSR